jgi:uncharacterized protein with von Willebrand factor type A (vWA) domain
MHDQRNLTKDAVLRAQIAMANRLFAEQSATIARAHSAIERAMETLRESLMHEHGNPAKTSSQ